MFEPETFVQRNGIWSLGGGVRFEDRTGVEISSGRVPLSWDQAAKGWRVDQ